MKLSDGGVCVAQGQGKGCSAVYHGASLPLTLSHTGVCNHASPGVLGGFITTGVFLTVALRSRGEFLEGTGVMGTGVVGRGKAREKKTVKVLLRNYLF